MPHTIETPNRTIKVRRWDNFIGGMQLRGPVDLTDTRSTTERTEEGYLAFLAGRASESGVLEPLTGNTAYNGTAMGGSGGADGMSGYVTEHGSSTAHRLVARDARLYSVPATGPSTDVGDIGSDATFRVFAQYRGYAWICGDREPLRRYRLNNITPVLSYAGTPPPAATPTCVASAGGSLAAGSYTYAYAIKYGRNGDLGMGWVKSAAVTTAASDKVTVSNLSTGAPTNYGDAYSAGLYRNTINTPNRFFLISASVDSSTPFASSYVDTASDASIYGGEEIDPDVATPGLPLPSVDCVFYNGRLWLFGISVSATELYPNRYMHSRISGANDTIAYYPDQFDPFATGEVASGMYGKITRAFEFGSTLFCSQQHAISALMVEPVEGGSGQFAKAAEWKVVVSGIGCVAPRSLAGSPFGVFFVSAEGPVLFNGSPNIQRISRNMTGVWTASTFTAAVGFWSPGRNRYVVKIGTTIWAYDVIHDSWHREGDTTHDTISVAATIEGEGCFQVSETADSADDFIWRYGVGSPGTWMGVTLSPTIVRTGFDNCGYPDRNKRAVAVAVHLGGSDMTFSVTGGVGSATIHFDGETTSAQTLTFGSIGSGKIRYAKIAGDVRGFETAQIRFTTSSANETASITAIDLLFQVDGTEWWT